MGIKKTLGGDRLGSGNRMKQDLHNFFRSNHNLSVTRPTSLAPGVLYPIYTNLALKGDTFDMDISAFVRTIPTQGPLFGAFKLQVDVFQVPIRLYQAILHNNTTEIGMNMDQVYLPKLEMKTTAKWRDGKWKEQISHSSLINYLGLSGIGRTTMNYDAEVTRKINAVPLLAYYDIFKNYYSNKQEENAYVITTGEVTTEIESNITNFQFIYEGNATEIEYTTSSDTSTNSYITTINTIDLVPNAIYKFYGTIGDLLSCYYIENSNPNPLSNNDFIITKRADYVELEYVGVQFKENISLYFVFEYTSTITNGIGTIRLQEFALKNIDTMRKRCLTYWDLGEEMVIDENELLLPYQANVKRTPQYPTEGANARDESLENYSKFPMQGLCVKTYQSDMFNNWLDTEWVNKITELSAVSTASGSFTIDALNFAKKVYNHYNRIAISGGTYDDWQEATYGDKVWGKAEKPIYCGGFSSEVIFDEVVSTAATADQPLGQLGGRGSLKGDRGGHVIIKVNEASFIMVMVSLTPRVTYTQGNAWYLTDLNSVDDMHKPMFDRIGFQDLLTDYFAWWGTSISPTGEITRKSVGKQPSWIHYQTDVDKAFGDMAEEDGFGYMILQRQYDYDQETRDVADVTTYIEPTKYNYAFADASLTAQNFWLFPQLKIEARRKMSAKQIPNL